MLDLCALLSALLTVYLLQLWLRGALRRGDSPEGRRARIPGQEAVWALRGGPQLPEREVLQALLPEPQAVDSICFAGFTENDKTFVLTRLARRPEGCCEVWVFIRIEGLGNFEHPIHPDTAVTEDSGKCWSGGGLKLVCLEPFRRWKIKFNGLLRKGFCQQQRNGAEREHTHVKLTLLWTAFTDVVDFETDCHLSTSPQASFLEKWRLKLSQSVHSFQEQISHYEQWGQYVGEVEIESHRKELFLRGIRSHDYGVWSWLKVHHFVRFLMHFEDGTSAHLTVICPPLAKKRFAVGYVLFPNGRKASIGWSNASQIEMADEGVIKGIYRFSFTAGGRFFDIRATVDKSACFKVYHGLKWEGKSYECIADFRLNVTVRGWGVVEFFYRNENGHHLVEPQSVDRFSEKAGSVSSKFALPFSQEVSPSSLLVGGKGAQLVWLTALQKKLRAQFTVPRGFCLTTLALEYQLEHSSMLREAVEQLAAVACKRQTGNLQEHCERCSDLFGSIKVASEVAEAVAQQLEQLGLQQASLAVRSSAAAEDSEEMSSAGQLCTELGLKGLQQVCEGIQKCWASLYSYQAVMYRKQRGQPVLSGMGVVIQQMVPADTAGVLFTLDPVTGNPGSMVINASYGLGESVVSGHVHPDTITLSRSLNDELQIVSKTNGYKQQSVQLSADGGTVTVSSSGLETLECCLSDDIIMTLAQIAIQVERSYGTPRDIEWAVKENIVYLLQARPVTTLDTASEFELMHEFDSALPSSYQWVTTANISEMMPGAVTPLTLSVVARAIEYAIQVTCIESGGLDSVKPYNFGRIEVYCGHLFINILGLSVTYEANNILNCKSVSLCAMMGQDLTELSNHDIILILGESPLWKKIWNGLKFAKYLMSSAFEEQQWERELQDFCFSSATCALELYRLIDEKLPLVCEAWSSSLQSSSSSSMWIVLLINALSSGKEKWTPEAMADIAILCNTCPDVISADIPTSMEALIGAIRKQEKREEFLDLDPPAAVSWLCSADSGEAGRLFERFLRKHGFRCLREVELREKSWAQHPAQLIPVIQGALKTQQTPKKKVPVSVEEAVTAIKTPITKFKKRFLQFLVRKAREGVSRREHSKALAVKTVHIFKRAYWALAQHMVEEGFLPDEDLLFFLTHSEIGEVLQQRPPALILRAHHRRRILDQQMALRFPETTEGRPVPFIPQDIEESAAAVMLTGVIISQGVVRGTARVLKTIAEASCIQEGDILVVVSTDVSWSSCFPLLGGLITEIGGIISHGAVVAREYGLPCIVSCKGATSFLKSGDNVILDAFKGTVQKLAET